MKSLVIFLGRACLSLIFISGAFNKILNWEESHEYLIGGLNLWLSATSSMPQVQPWLEMVFPMTPFLLILATLLEGLGGLFLFLGVKPRLGAFLLLLFIIPTTILLHFFWIVPSAEKELQMIMFLKNLSIVGGLLLFLAYGEKESASK